MMRFGKRVAGVFLLLTATSLLAAPSVFVRNKEGYGWWLTEMEARILGKAAGRTSTEQLSKYLQDTMLYSPYAVCALEAVQSDTYVGLDRAVQADIDATKPNVSFRIEAVTPNGRKILGQSVVFEGCDPEDPRGAALLVTDSVTGEILRWDPLGNRTTSAGRSYPAWVMFLSPREGDELFSFSGCTECGAQTNVYYDVTRQRIYTEYNGH